ncbi:MAG TPA: hypothetical protein VGP47_10985 [Parachlamydiaceae bacterium]|nr:hypothetical protein [Parachlamydiaceae bacterium]
MIGTLFSIILAGLLWFDPHTYELSLGMVTRGIMIATALAFLLALPLAYMFSWLPLQNAEQNSTPRILELFHKDKYVHFSSGWLAVFSLATLVLASDVIYPSLSQQQWFFPAWIVLLGISIDMLSSFLKRVLSYVNPFAVVKMFTKQAKIDIAHDHELDLCDSIDSLAEVAIKGIDKHSTSICHVALNEEQQIARQFLEASKSIAHPSQDAETRSMGITDKVSYILFYLYQRLDIVFNKALKNQLEPTCSLIIKLLGKISIDAARYDVSLASVPLNYIGKCARRAQEQGYDETVLTASCVLLEVAREMISDIDLTYYEIKDPFFSIINGMEVLSSEAFKRDKTMNINLLMQPFKDLRALFESDKVMNHQDTPVIVQNIDRVIGEYEALLVVMNQMPAIPRIEDDIAPTAPTAPLL